MATEASLPTEMRAILAEDGKCTLASRPVPTPKGREVLVRIHTTAINRADTLQRKGSYAPPPGESDILGLEMAGEVVAKGPDCVLRIPDGSHVMSLLGSGGYAEYVVVDERLLMRKPDGMDFHTAAAIPETWLTAYQLLHFVGEVKEGDTVLIHAAGSGVGTAAIQLAVAAGARVIAVAGTSEKLELATSLGAFATANYKEGPFAPIVKGATDDKGVDLILDCVGASNWAQNAESAAMDARWVLFGLMGGAQPDAPVLANILRKRIRLEGTTLRARSLDYKIRLSNEFASHAIPRFVSGAFRPIIFRVFGLSEAGDAHALMETNVNIGKILLDVVPADAKK